MRWKEKQHQKQLEHYSPKRTYNYEVDLGLEPEPPVFMQGTKCTVTISGRLYKFDYFHPWHPAWLPTGDMLNWLQDNIGNDYYICRARGVLSFTKPEDAMAFKMVWI